MTTPEAQARRNIDKQLEACGWVIQNRNAMNLYAGQGVAVLIFPIDISELLAQMYIVLMEIKMALVVRVGENAG